MIPEPEAAKTDDEATPAVRLQDVAKRLGTTAALDGITLDVPVGVGTAIAGETGSGKSTLLSLVIGLLRPDRGLVHVLGRPLDYDDPAPQRRRMGYSIQQVALFPHLRVRENIALAARLARWSSEEIELRLQQLLALMALSPDLLRRYPPQLSGGQQQRAAICRAMMLRPELLLLDEPFSGLDPVTKGVELHAREAATFLLVTHDLAEARRLAEQIVILREGRLIEAGPADRVIRAPKHEYSRQLIRSQLGEPDA
jgi:osmoprotectant transport system ATP-binding protein